MRDFEKEVIQALLDDEQKVLKDLESNYVKTLSGIKQKIKLLLADAEVTQLRSKIYQLQYQQALEKQISGFLKVLESGNVTTIQDYLQRCYEQSFIGNVYSLQCQDVPLMLPINQEQMIQAISRPTEGYTLSQRIYRDVAELQNIVKAEIARGIASNMMYKDIARNIANVSEANMNKAYRIARTEGHRVQNQARMDSMQAAKKKGADVVKQWDSTLDGKTRSEHRVADGQIRELDEDFEVGGEKLKAPGIGGSAWNVCNCRCCMLQRARWAAGVDRTKYVGKLNDMTDDEILPMAQQRGLTPAQLREYSEGILPVKAKDFADFKRQYDKLWNYKGSDLEKQVNARMAGYKKQ